MNFDELFALAPAGPVTPGAAHWTAPGAPPTDERMVFGGLVVAQAILAASAGARRCHSVHALFIGMGEKQQPFQITVERTRDGGSFATRHVRVCQEDRLLLTAYTSHHDGNEGPEHQTAMPAAPAPETLEDFLPIRLRHDAEQGRPERHYLAEQLLDVRHVPMTGKQPPDCTQIIWFKARAKFAEAAPAASVAMHQAAIAFASDMGLVYAGLRTHRGPGMPTLQTASLDHSVWFHRDAPADEWMLYALRSPLVRNGRGIAHGEIFTRSGELVASVAQEFLARSSKPKA